MQTLHQLVHDHMKDMEIPAVLQQVPSQLNYPWLWAFVDLKGKERFGLEFRLYPNDVHVFIRLIIWFMKDANAAAEFNIRLTAGLLINGPVGCGKTSLVRLLLFLPCLQDRPAFRSCREISFEVETDGIATILHYTKHSFDYINDKPRTYIFDDLGSEPNVNHYGIPLSPMSDILMGRYDYFLSHGMQTIITSNLNADEVEHRYGTRVRSRLREMMNLVAFPMSAGDKR